MDASAQTAYYLLLSFFPFCLFLLTLISLVPIDLNPTLHELLDALPTSVSLVLEQIINETAAGFAVPLISISFLVGIWAASRGTSALVKALNKQRSVVATDISVPKRVLSIYLRGIFFAVFFALLIILSLVFVVFWDFLIATLSRGLGIEIGLDFLKLPFRALFVFAMLYVIVAAAYALMPDGKMRFRDIWFGALVASLLLSAASFVFFYYVAVSTRFSILYGA